MGHGDVIEGPGFTFEALHTPGHISNHLCFAWREGDALFSGDHVMGWSTTIIPPPDGGLADYLASLELLFDRTEARYFPTHGPSIDDPAPFVRQLHAHRHARTRQVLEILAGGPVSIAELVEVAYVDVRRELHRAARRSITSHLFELERTGVVAREGRTWFLT